MASVQKQQSPTKKPAKKPVTEPVTKPVTKPVRKPVRKPAAAPSYITVGSEAAAQIPTPAAQLLLPMLNAINLSTKLQNNARELLALIRNNRPASTQKAYIPKQEEYSAFYHKYGFPDNKTVTDNKLLLFFHLKIIKRPLKTRNRNTNNGVNTEDSRLLWQLVQQYIMSETLHCT